MNLKTNDFELFGLAPTYAQDRAVIDAIWKALQREAHPDKFSSHGPAAQRIAMQWSVRINEAYQRLKDPVKRAAYLCELNGAPINAESNTTMPAAFLMKQMEWRESLDDAVGVSELDSLAKEVEMARQQTLEQCDQLLDAKPDYREAAQQVRALMFIERFSIDVENRIDRINFA